MKQLQIIFFIIFFSSIVVIVFASQKEFQWGGTGYDPALKQYKEYNFSRYTCRFHYNDETIVDILVDSKETVKEVGQMNLMTADGVSVSSQSCGKATRHITAPWACSFHETDLESLTGIGKIKTADGSQRIILEDTIDFDALKNFIKQKHD